MPWATTMVRTPRFNRKLVKSTKDAYEKPPLSLLAGGPESVSRTVERAISARRRTPATA